MTQLKRCIVVYLLIPVMIIALAACSPGPAACLAQNVVVPAAVPAAAGAKAMLDYLKAARGDLDLIDTIMADKDIGLLDESDSSEEVTQDKLTHYEGILKGYSDQIHDILTGIEERTTPNHPDVEKFVTAEKTAFQTLDSILSEYNQALSYAGVILDVFDSVSSLSNTKETDLQKIYDAYNAKIKKAVKKLQETKAPSFLESTNQDVINALQQMDDAVLYALNAAAMDDPLRTDSAEYRIGILSRHFDSISKEWAKDLTDRQNKLREDSLAVQKTAKGLENWLDTNIAALGG